jgi:cation diffusion facilitator family transporter
MHTHSHTLDTTDPLRYRQSRKVAWVSLALNFVLTVAQIAVGVIGHSQALVADGLHTLSDLVTDGIVLFALKHGAKAADEEHPYGHGRIETATTLILGALLLAVAGAIAVQAGERLLGDAPTLTPSALTLWVALITLATKEGLYRYVMRTAKRYDSALLKAAAWHSRSDAISSLIVVLGIGGAIYGYGYLDAIAAIIVSFMVAKIGIGFAWHALQELIDTALAPEERDAIRRVIEGVSGVKALHLLRTRRVGNQALVDVHILVDRHLSVSEGHQIGEVVRSRLIDQIAPVSDVTVHVDSEEDSDGIDHPSLPLRDEMLQRLERCFAEIPEARLIERTTLHYMSGHVNVELRLPLTALQDPQTGRRLAQRFVEAARADKDVGQVEVGFY